MKIGLLSDTHDHVANLTAALDIFRRKDITTLIHCGDLTSPEIAGHLTGFEVIYLTGNMDTASQNIREALMSLNPSNRILLTFAGEFEGVSVAATHGHKGNLLDELVRSGRYTYVFHGHTHRRRDETVEKTRIINPGALGGLQLEPRFVCLLELGTAAARFVRVAD